MSDSPTTTIIPSQRDHLIETFMQRNEKINLSAIRTPQEIYIKHILDSLELNKLVDLSSKTILGMDTLPKKSNDTTKRTTLLDLGTGGGFPLIPLAITNPLVKCFGLDSTRKKLTAVQAIADELELINVSTIRSRAEEHKEKYDIITIRAVGYADKLIPRALPLVEEGGLLCLYKLRTKQEDDVILDLVRAKKLTLGQLHHYTLPGDEYQRIIYIIQK